MILSAFLLAAVGLPLLHDAAVCEHHDSLWPLGSEGVVSQQQCIACVLGGGGEGYLFCNHPGAICFLLLDAVTLLLSLSLQNKQNCHLYNQNVTQD